MGDYKVNSQYILLDSLKSLVSAFRDRGFASFASAEYAVVSRDASGGMRAEIFGLQATLGQTLACSLSTRNQNAMIANTRSAVVAGSYS